MLLHRKLKVWQKAMDLVIESHRLARQLPIHERQELGSQLRRAAVSIPANIAEGNGRLHRREYVHHLSIARGSLLELDTHLEVARRLGYLQDCSMVSACDLIDQVSRMLSRMITRLRT